MKLLIVVDYQYDFAASDGKLTAGEGALAIEKPIAEKIKAYKARGDKVVFTLDCHFESDWSEMNHREAAVFPRHCIKGTPGYELYGVIKPLSGGCEFIPKRAYCPDIENSLLKDFMDSSDEVEICGLVTDICVFQSAVGIYTYIINKGLKTPITVDKKACASFNPEREQWSLNYMKEVMGINIIE